MGDRDRIEHLRKLACQSLPHDPEHGRRWSQYHHALQAAYERGVLIHMDDATNAVAGAVFPGVLQRTAVEALRDLPTPRKGQQNDPKVSVSILGPDEHGDYWLNLGSAGKGCAINLGNPSGTVAPALFMAAAERPK